MTTKQGQYLNSPACEMCTAKEKILSVNACIMHVGDINKSFISKNHDHFTASLTFQPLNRYWGRGEKGQIFAITFFFNFLTNEDIISNNQSGFCSLHSSVTALLEATHNWAFNIDRGNVNAVVFLDLKKDIRHR